MLFSSLLQSFGSCSGAIRELKPDAAAALYWYHAATMGRSSLAPVHSFLPASALFLCFRVDVLCRLHCAHICSHGWSTKGVPGLGAGVLWSVAPRLVWFLLGYAAAGTWLTTSVFGRRLMRLHYGILRREGDLRFDLVRVRENAGAVPDALVQLCAVLAKADLLYSVSSSPWGRARHVLRGCRRGQASGSGLPHPPRA